MKKEKYYWDNVKIGGGGYVTGMVIHPLEKDLIYIRTDVGGAYRWQENEKRWMPLLDGLELAETNLYSVDGIALAPSNPDLVYLACGAYDHAEPHDILKSVDRGQTWQKTNFWSPDDREKEKNTFGGNEDNRWIGECIAVDPDNSDLVFVGTRQNGLWKSRNGAKTWEKISEIGDDNQIRNVLIKKNNRGEKIIYAGFQNKGIFFSEDQGVSWNHIYNSDEYCSQLQQIDFSGGILYVTTQKGLYKYDGQWVDISPEKEQWYNAITIDQNDCNHLLVVEYDYDFEQTIWRSNDGGQNWIDTSSNCKRNFSVPWFPEDHFSSATSSITFDPHHPGRVWFTDWYAIWRTPDISGSPVEWYSYENGHEETVAFTAVSPPKGANLLTGMADNDGFRHPDVTSYPQKKFGNPDIQETVSIDFCESNPDFIVRVGSWGWGERGSGGYSIDNGVNWQEFKSFPSDEDDKRFANGRIAVSATDSDSLVVIPINQKPFYSKDRGESWTESKGAPFSIIPTFWCWMEPLASDRVNGSLFYLFDTERFYQSYDGGKQWHIVNESLPQMSTSKDQSVYRGWYSVKSVPGREKEVWVNLNEKGLFKSKDGGHNFSKIKGIEVAYLFCFGKSADNYDYPAIFVMGQINGIKGIFRSLNGGHKWIKINDEQHKMSNGPKNMAGDRQKFGRVYIGTAGRGYFYGEPQK